MWGVGRKDRERGEERERERDLNLLEELFLQYLELLGKYTVSLSNCNVFPGRFFRTENLGYVLNSM
jgi:hypothetical protein